MLERISILIGYDLPWQIWLLPAGGVVLAAFLGVSRFLGLRNGVYAAAAATFLVSMQLLDRRARQSGWKKRISKEERDAEELVARAKRAERAARDLEPDRLREDDGFKRRQ